jgi:hypothetical protein
MMSDEKSSGKSDKTCFGFHSYPMLSVSQLTFSSCLTAGTCGLLLFEFFSHPCGSVSCHKEGPTCGRIPYDLRSASVRKPPRKVCWHGIQLMNPFPDYFSRCRFSKVLISNLLYTNMVTHFKISCATF